MDKNYSMTIHDIPSLSSLQLQPNATVRLTFDYQASGLLIQAFSKIVTMRLKSQIVLTYLKLCFDDSATSADQATPVSLPADQAGQAFSHSYSICHAENQQDSQLKPYLLN